MKFTVIGHVKGRETGIGIPKHGLNGVVAVDSAPTTTSLPHTVEHSAYLQRIVAVLHCYTPLLGHSNLAPDPEPPGFGRRLGFGVAHGAQIRESSVY